MNINYAYFNGINPNRQKVKGWMEHSDFSCEKIKLSFDSSMIPLEMEEGFYIAAKAFRKGPMRWIKKDGAIRFG
jgi:hypothetical protein